MHPTEDLDSTSKILRSIAGSALPKYLTRSCARKFRRRNLGKRILSTTTRGSKLITVIGDNVDNEIALTGAFESHITKIISAIAENRKGLFLDIGCHLGYYSALVAAVSDGIEITAVDANPVMARRCKENMEINGITASVINVGVGNEPAELDFNTSLTSPSLGTFGENPPDGIDLETIRVKVIPFSEILDGCEGAITLMKMDVEGFEYLALSSLRPDQISRIENLILEFSDIRLHQCGQSRKNFENLGWINEFNLKLIPEHGEPIPLGCLNEVPAGDQNVWFERKA